MIDQSALFLAIVDKITSIGPNQLLEELMKVVEKNPETLNCFYRKNLSSAFVWVETPQGHDFWSALDRECLNGD
jgi:hypothetical protein